MKRFFFGLLMVLMYLNSHGQRLKFKVTESDDEKIVWSSDKKLTWDDFKGEAPTTKNNTAAMTSSEFIVQTRSSSINNNADVFIENIFVCHDSWVKQDKVDVPGLLEHEQAHFDLGEIYARKLRKRVVENPDKSKISIYIQEAYESLNEIQNLYDRETKHSINKVKQEEWLIKIAEQLRNLEKYSY